MMREEQSVTDDLIEPLDRSKVLPFGPVATSDGLAWVGIEESEYRSNSVRNPDIAQPRRITESSSQGSGLIYLPTRDIDRPRRRRAGVPQEHRQREADVILYSVP
jgi:hypothetical protein